MDDGATAADISRLVPRPLGRSGGQVSPLGLGAMELGRNQQVKIPGGVTLPSERDVAHFLNLALDYGITLIDTAPAYGLSEGRIGRTLAARRSEYVLTTKVGEEFNGTASRYDFTPHSIRRSLTASLRRLRTDHVDVCLLHCPPQQDLAVIEDPVVIATLEDLKREGKVRLVGASTTTTEGTLRAVSCGVFDVLMVTYNIFYRDELTAIRKAADRGVGILVKKPLSSGRLTHRVHLVQATEPEYYQATQRLEEIARQAGEDVSGLALRYVLAEIGVSSLIVGMSTPEHLYKNLRVIARGALDPAVIAEVNAVISYRLPPPRTVA